MNEAMITCPSPAKSIQEDSHPRSSDAIIRFVWTWTLAIALCIGAGLVLAELMAWLLAPGWSVAAGGR